jgi:hypothetical protein
VLGFTPTLGQVRVATTMKKIKKLFLTTKGGIGPSARNQMIIATTMEGANIM